MDLRHLRHFIAVAEEQHFGRAATQLGIEQSPLSRSIRNLEDQLGCRLFTRSAQGSQLTVAGDALLPEAKAILALTTRLKAKARMLKHGRSDFVSVGVCDSIASPRLATYLSTLIIHSPELTIDLQSLIGDQTVTAVQQGRIDVAFTLGRGDIGRLCRTHFWSERLDVAVATGHQLARASSVPLATLLAADQLIVAQPWATVTECWLREVAGNSDVPPIGIVPTVPAFLSFIGLGLGIALVPCGVATTFSRTDVTVRRIAGHQPRLPAVMLSHPDARRPAIDALRELARRQSNSRLTDPAVDPAAPAENPDHSP